MVPKLGKNYGIWNLKNTITFQDTCYLLNTGRGTWTRILEEMESYNPKCLFSLEHMLQTFVVCCVNEISFSNIMHVSVVGNCCYNEG